MQSEIEVGQRFKFNILSDNPSQERQARTSRSRGSYKVGV
jgi:hypothetical protein